jgi:hypothetical protein
VRRSDFVRTMITTSQVTEEGPVVRGSEGREQYELRTFRGGGHPVGVDLDDNATLLALMDEPR